MASYTQAVRTAKDRVEPRVKLALAHAARRDYVQAAYELKLALALDPQWPAHALALDDFFGQQNFTAKVMVKDHVLNWAKEDIRDPDRLFLMGALLHFDGDARGITLIETAARLQGQEPHLMAFLAPESVSAVSAVVPGNPNQASPIPTTPAPADPRVQPTPAAPEVLSLPDLPKLPSLQELTPVPNDDSPPPLPGPELK